MMLTLTASARAYFKHFLDTQPEGTSLVFSVSHSGCSGLKYQTQAERVSKDDPAYLSCVSEDFSFYMAKEALPYLEGMTVDCRCESLGQKKIVYLNPKATKICGCGESFGLKGGDGGH